jgi:hypothetical protein
MASVVVVLFRPPDFTTNARHHKCLIFSKCSVSPTDFAEEAFIFLAFVIALRRFVDFHFVV